MKERSGGASYEDKINQPLFGALRSSFWFIPILLILGAITTAATMVTVDRPSATLPSTFPGFSITSIQAL